MEARVRFLLQQRRWGMGSFYEVGKEEGSGRKGREGTDVRTRGLTWIGCSGAGRRCEDPGRLARFICMPRSRLIFVCEIHGPFRYITARAFY